MSLTTFILNKDVKDKFAAEFFYLKFAVRKTPSAPPLTNHYSLVGTAFDYFLRFYVKRLNRHAIEQEWIAELAFKMMRPGSIAHERTKKILKDAKLNYAEYLKTGKVNNSLLKTALQLAQIDPFYRRIGFNQEPSWILQLGKTDSNDVKDLKQLIALVEPKVFTAKTRCFLNPAFERARMIGGADIDLVLDDMLVEIKTTQLLEFKREYFDQLMGYYSLFQLGGIKGFPRRCKINRVGIYYARFGIFCEIRIKNAVDEVTYPKFLRWFERRIKGRIS